MIFILHYILLCGALPAVVVYLSIFLERYSDASMSEIGTLLMAMPFLSVLLKPLVCSLADRHQAHKYYLMGALACMSLGYGSLAVAPYFPEFIRDHGRLVWYMDIFSVIVGAGAYNIVFTLGDAMAVNGAQMAGVSWGSYRVWALVSWGVFGALGAQVNELHELKIAPRYVPAIYLLVFLLTTEIVLLAIWPNRYFVMYGNLKLELNHSTSPAKSLVNSPEIFKRPTTCAETHCDKSASKPAQTVVGTRVQLGMLKIIAKRDKCFLGYLAMFASIGFVMYAHLTYFYMHVERQSHGPGQPRFSLMTGGLMMAHSAFEIVALLLLPRATLHWGRTRVVSASLACYCLMLVYHATYLASGHLSLLWAIPLEGLHGLTTATVYTLLNDVSLEIVERLDQHMVELVECKLIAPDITSLELKSSLRATMQGLMGGALDGLGGGLGALVGGLVLDHYNFGKLWALCALVSLTLTLLYPLARWLAGANSSQPTGKCRLATGAGCRPFESSN